MHTININTIKLVNHITTRKNSTNFFFSVSQVFFVCFLVAYSQTILTKTHFPFLSSKCFTWTSKNHRIKLENIVTTCRQKFYKYWKLFVIFFFFGFLQLVLPFLLNRVEWASMLKRYPSMFYANRSLTIPRATFHSFLRLMMNLKKKMLEGSLFIVTINSEKGNGRNSCCCTRGT